MYRIPNSKIFCSREIWDNFLNSFSFSSPVSNQSHNLIYLNSSKSLEYVQILPSFQIHLLYVIFELNFCCYLLIGFPLSSLYTSSIHLLSLSSIISPCWCFDYFKLFLKRAMVSLSCLSLYSDCFLWMELNSHDQLSPIHLSWVA